MPSAPRAFHPGAARRREAGRLLDPRCSAAQRDRPMKTILTLLFAMVAVSSAAAAPQAPLTPSLSPAGGEGGRAARTAAAPPNSAPNSTASAASAAFTDAEAASLFTSGPLAKARADLEAERWDAAAKGFERSDEPEARYLRAIALVEARRGTAALKALAALEEKLPDLSDRIAFWRARAHELAGEGRAAATAYAAVREGSLLWADAQLARARALQAAGDRAAALEALAPILSLPAPDEVTRGDTASEALLLDGRLRAAGKGTADLTWARRAFIECWAGHPLSAAAQTCLAELKKLPRSASAPPTPEEALRRDEALLDANRNAPALAELTKLVATLPPPGDGEALACRARFALGKAYRKERQHTKAIEILKPVVEKCEDPQLRVRAVYVLASASSIVAPEEGVVWYRTLARDYPAHPFADDALFYAADLLARSGHTEEALAALADLSEKYPKGDFRAEALFRIAWIRALGQPRRRCARLALAARARLRGE